MFLYFTEKLVSEIKDCLQNKYESVTESLENYVTKRVDALNTINKELIDEREHLEKLKKELEVRGTELEKKEKQIVEQEKKFDKNQEKCKKELIKEKEEILRLACTSIPNFEVFSFSTSIL
jgi:predicted  nucleic acid-binding Zn-ribbon protein